jgi:hypothetical protein
MTIVEADFPPLFASGMRYLGYYKSAGPVFKEVSTFLIS